MVTPRTTTGPLPPECITAPALRALANALDRLAAFHRDRGGVAPGTPCLVELRVDGREISARVLSGKQTYRLVLIHNVWEFR